MCQQYRSFCSRCNTSWTTYSFPCCRQYCTDIQYIPDTPRLCNYHAHTAAIETRLESDRLQRERDRAQATIATMYNNFQVATRSWITERNNLVAETSQAVREAQEARDSLAIAQRSEAAAREQLKKSVNVEEFRWQLKTQLRRSLWGC